MGPCGLRRAGQGFGTVWYEESRTETSFCFRIRVETRSYCRFNILSMRKNESKKSGWTGGGGRERERFLQYFRLAKGCTKNTRITYCGQYEL